MVESARTRFLRGGWLLIRTKKPDVNRAHRRHGPGLGVVLLAPTLLAFTGCMVGPDFKRPKVDVSESWLESGHQRVSTDAATYRNWWTTFNDAALNRLVERAYRENL